MLRQYLQKLNKDQVLPVKDTEGAVLVIAGAGSGKTRVLTSRIAYLIMGKHVEPSRILAITFTNKAADEMKLRLEKMVGDLDGMWVSTIHSMCVKILRASIPYLGFEKNFSIYSEDDKDRVLKRIINEMELEPDKFLKLAKNAISSAKNSDLSPKEYKEEHIRSQNIGVITEIFSKYQEELKKSNALDFDDLLIKTLHLFEDFPEVLAYYTERFQYVHIDEFQDTNVVQYKIAKLLSSYHGNIFVVGDDDQSIYGWRGAKISNILDFEDDFAGAKVYKLEQNYRSTKNILNCANLIIRNNSSRKDKVLWTENDAGEKPEYYQAYDESAEAEYVATKIKSLIRNGKKASDFAVLMRVNAISRSFEQEFLKYNIPYKVFGGFKFFDRKEIKDLTAYLRAAVNPLDNEAILRVINVPRRGIGDKSIEAIIEYATYCDCSIFEAICANEHLPLNASAKNRIADFKDTLYNLMLEVQNYNAPDFIKLVIEKVNFLSQFEEDTEENESKKLNVSELVNSAEEFVKANANATLTDYLGSITLSSDTDEFDEGNYVSVATIHSVKGLEFDTVFMVGLEETVFPISRATDSEEEIEEERRLCYVAITRARKDLFISRAKSRYLYGNRQITLESRFIKEIIPLLKEKSVGGYNGGYNSGYGNGYNRQDRSQYGYKRDQGSDYGYYSDEAPSRTFGATKSFSSGFKLNANVPKKAESVVQTKFHSGMKVHHKKFGNGTVIAVKDGGKVVDVAFLGFGIKSLATEYAPLEIVK
ncbi:MAG: UvrD-helicase domain-containing protein [Clostridia bacterium]|nr:UvrD-helicase domain-containing protein [Clostridia bacterium]